MSAIDLCVNTHISPVPVLGRENGLMRTGAGTVEREGKALEDG
jgi:hypothetical protein